MARFVFKLEALLAHRREVEREHQRRVAVLQQQASRLAARIQQAQQDIAAENGQLTREKLVGTLDLAYIAHEKRFVGSLRMLIVTTMQELAAMEKTMAAAKAELRAAAKARKVIEKLRDQQWARWLAEENRREAIATDEIGTQLAVRRMIDLDTGTMLAGEAGGA